MACHTSSFGGYAFHRAAIAKQDKGVVVHNVVSWLVEGRGCVCLSNGQTDRIGETLSKRSCGDFDAGCIVCFRVTRGDAINTLDKSAWLFISCRADHVL